VRLWLRPLRDEDEDRFRAAHEAMATEGFEFGLGLDRATSWRSYLDELAEERRGRVAPDRVPATFLVAIFDDQIVGRTSIRHTLNDFLARDGGHIGYGVLREHRGHGFATEILRQSVIVARSEGVTRVLVTCDEHNVASSTVIERCGGILDSVVDGVDLVRKRRYWIN